MLPIHQCKHRNLIDKAQELQPKKLLRRVLSVRLHVQPQPDESLRPRLTRPTLGFSFYQQTTTVRLSPIHPLRFMSTVIFSGLSGSTGHLDRLHHWFFLLEFAENWGRTDGE